MGNKRTSSSQRWLARHHADYYVAQARQAGYRSRSAYKLLEIQQKDKIFTPGMRIVDLGAAPGGWSQVAAQCVGGKGKVLAIDILPMESLKGVDIVQGDFQKMEILEALTARLENESVDLVISDLAPNLTGIRSVDAARVGDLAENVLIFVEKVLVKKGGLLIKLFQGPDFLDYVSRLKSRFSEVVVRKPQSSRAESSEVYLLAKGYLSIVKEQTRGLHLERYA